MIIITEKSNLSSLQCDKVDFNRLKDIQDKLIKLLQSGASAQFSLDCNISGKKSIISVRASSSLGFFEKLFNKVIG